MALENFQITMLNKLALLEESMNRLYNLYAGRFPEEKDFWMTIAGEEAQHATWVKRLMPRVDEGLVFFQKGRFNESSIESTLQYLATLIAQAEQGGLELINALSIAHDIESSLIEKEYYTVFKSDLAEFRELLSKLAQATKGHAQRVQAVWDKYRPV
ncbi:MAG: hypothetical protein PHY34_06295 [Patescibacteria group bacterium]|nr:hypothetical protein [Patescibacteria group bacterium]MDD5715740.1 hypothetical protein [Patescibacteria group bacterium]